MQKQLLSNSQAVEALKKEYEELNPASPSHADWCKKRISNAVEFEGGLIYEFVKPDVKKDFCFGAGMYASCTDEEQDAASSMVEKFRTDSQYFIEENFKEAFGGLERLFADRMQGSYRAWDIFAKSNRFDKEIKRCIMSNHWRTSQNNKEKVFREFLNISGATIHDLPAGMFKESKTMVATCLVIVNK